nr:hypothetical protein [uncultured Mediterranean phage uvMED]
MSPFKSIKGRALGKLLEGYKSSDIGKGFGGGSSPSPGFVQGTGGTVSGLYDPTSEFAYHTFLSPGYLSLVGDVDNADIFVVAPGGGGAGGNGASGGGAAGGIVLLSGTTLRQGEYTITLPAGGVGGVAANDSGATGGDATVTNSGGLSLTAKGGGGGSGWTQSPIPGGSGGGAAGPGADVGGLTIQASAPNTAGPGGGSLSTYGFNGGGTPGGSPYMGGGGGGSSSVGTDGGPQPGGGGNGAQFPDFAGPLIGLPFLNPFSGKFAGGGGGMGESPVSRDGGIGGEGGGGRGAIHNNAGGGGWSGSNGTLHTGSGGGGGQWSPSVVTPGGNGASGMVVIRYPQVNSPFATGSAHTVGYRYWRLYKLNGAGGGPWHNEIQWFEKGATSFYNGSNYQNYTGSGLVGFNASNVTDNNSGNNCFHTDSSAAGSWLKLDLGSGNKRLFDRVKIWLGGGAVICDWQVQASNDGSTWVVMHNRARMQGATYQQIDMGRVT